MATSLPRITTRIDTDTKELLAEAAAIIGVSSINSFVLSAAIEKAKQIMDSERSLKLSQQDALLLVQALDKDLKPNPRLKQAAQRYKKTGNK
ncbi:MULTISPECIES: DUF1778 domain-containing protein [unclassified Endozoicomonas]|uniref:type II toxin-antitoxin system TacA family antitoxin n=1 Tax=unclassified Endozoicomonas TaxID=2644528 RepID=UPI0021481205|nr:MULTISPECIES: DUF1778 domain-containing protein [unclassified Endozoicomonas]